MWQRSVQRYYWRKGFRDDNQLHIDKKKGSSIEIQILQFYIWREHLSANIWLNCLFNKWLPPD